MEYGFKERRLSKTILDDNNLKKMIFSCKTVEMF